MSSMGDSDTDGDRPLLHNGPSLFWPKSGGFHDINDVNANQILWE
jgi:hypothetical protein